MMLGYAPSLAGRRRADESRGLSSRTVKNIADSVKSVFTDAVEEGLIGSNPCVWNDRSGPDPGGIPVRHGHLQPDEARDVIPPWNCSRYPAWRPRTCLTPGSEVRQV
jgi:hypothetical protein